MKIAIIIAYFGKLPEYIQLFLDSCKLNYGFEWLIFSDDDTTYNYPSNVHLIKMNFGECKKLIQSKFDFEITLSKPQKLCDYKCAYGVIFEDYIQDYDWWGHCDLDQIFGNLFQIYSVNGELHTREFPYVHLQKRKMRDLRKNKNSDNYYLIPNCFIDKDINPSVLLRVCTIWRVFNYQFFRVKINSLKYRFKNSDWKFTNVFK